MKKDEFMSSLRKINQWKDNYFAILINRNGQIYKLVSTTSEYWDTNATKRRGEYTIMTYVMCLRNEKYIPGTHEDTHKKSYLGQSLSRGFMTLIFDKLQVE